MRSASSSSPPPKRRAATGLLVLAAGAGLVGVVLALRCPAALAPAPASSPAPPSAIVAPPPSAAIATRGRAITPEISAADDDDVALDVFSLRVAETRFDVVNLAMGRDLVERSEFGG